MTDEQIIKALECCSCETIMYCKEQCPFFEKCMNDEPLSKYALELINRQKEEIERLKEQVNLWQEEASSVGCENEWLKACLKEKNAEIEDLKKDINHYKINLPYLEYQNEDFCGVPCKFMEELIEKAKAEAIKEFAERLKYEGYRFMEFGSGWKISVSEIDIDNLVKEMVGEG